MESGFNNEEFERTERKQVSELEENDWLCHLNLGWGGRGNGWYMRDCFDSTEQVNIEANNSIQEINIKPLAAEGEFRYTWMFNIIIIEY